MKFFVNIVDDELKPATSETSENYTLIINEQMIEIKADTYVGFLRGLETFSQTIQSQSEKLIIENVPIVINDAPFLAHRGIMLDTARHFLKLSTILRTIDGMVFNKLNVLHLHLTDDESFPVYLTSFPNITFTGAYTKTEIYTQEDIKSIIDYATFNGVRVIPEIDSPGHARSWGLSDQFGSMTIQCDGGEDYNGQLDPTMDLTYQANQGIFNDIQRYFPDQYVHFGGDEVSGRCWDKKPSIKKWMDDHNISDYTALQQYYRSKQREFLKPGRIPIFWANQLLHIPPVDGDVIQFWGPYDTVSLLKDVKNKIIISPDDYYYVNSGLGFIWGNPFGTYTKWFHIYDMDPIPQGFTKDRILGGEVCLWGEVNVDATTDNNLWPRAAAMGGRLWTEKKLGSLDVTKALISMENILVSREGIKSSPVTRQYCAVHPEECFTN